MIAWSGFFPHSRGWSQLNRQEEGWLRVFPALAGVIPILNRSTLAMASFSRTRGGDPIAEIRANNRFRFFPHTRGWSHIKVNCTCHRIVFPAHAGVILATSQSITATSRFSRTCGGDPISMTDRDLDTLFFPHSRRWSRFKRGYICHRWVFPAHAGVIPDKAWQWCLRLSFSRTRGGDPRQTQMLVFALWFFPHMRGWSRSRRPEESTQEVFPAYAGVILSFKISLRRLVGFSRTRGGDPDPTEGFVVARKLFPHMRGWSWCNCPS